MSEKTLTLEIVTPERMLLREEVATVVVPAAYGYLGVLPGHAPLVAGLVPGVLRYRLGNNKNRLAISGGFMEIANNKVVILADTAEPAQEINVRRAQQAYERACQRLKQPGEGVDEARAEAALRRAVARLQAVKD
ncbi:MAG: F0F1 ATP synthase subunit epsilon [Syntrophomonadaceae bacterium]|jgi:F-type H+-transporting ATPase subunit epsilon|nr:F0F1 ATP synthase subunit epsilon [Syntrophomonadaceae bacterium]